MLEKDEHADVLKSRFSGAFGTKGRDEIEERKANERKSTMTPKQRARAGRERTVTLNLRTTEEMSALLSAIVKAAGEGATKTDIIERGIRKIAADMGLQGGRDAE